MRRALVLGLLAAASLFVGCGRDHLVNPPHDSPRDPLTPGAPGAPAQPGALGAEAVTATSVTLHWTMSDSTGVARYRVYRQSQSESAYRLTDSTVIQRAMVAGLQTGVLYSFRIAAVNSVGLEGPGSEPLAVRPVLLGIVLDGGAPVTNSPTLSVQVTAAGFTQARLAAQADSLVTAPYVGLTGGPLGFNLTGPDGVRTVYAQFRDASTGIESAVVSDDIRLDRVAVISSVTENTGGAAKTAGQVIHFRLDATEPDGSASLDLGTARTGLTLYDDGTHGDASAGDGAYELDYTVESTYDASAQPVVGHFTDRAGNVAIPVTAPGLVTVVNPPPAVTLKTPVLLGGGQVLLQWSQSGVADFAAYRAWHARTSPVLLAATRILDSTVTVRGSTTLTVRALNAATTYYFAVEVVDVAGNATPSNEVSATLPAPQTAPAQPEASGTPPAVARGRRN